MLVSNNWKDYECIDAGTGEKLERWKDIILRRPDPWALWTHENTQAGECWSFLLVTDDQDSWQYEIDTYGQGFVVFAYVWNVDEDMFSELGDVVVQSFGGGIRRIG